VRASRWRANLASRPNGRQAFDFTSFGLSQRAELSFCDCIRPPSVICTFLGFGRKIRRMPYLPQQTSRRPDRIRFAELIPVVLRFKDGRRATGNLQVVSITGGLLSVPHPITQGSIAKLMFLTRAGSVLGMAEMLSPVSWDQQPFRFVCLHHDDASRLKAAIQSSREQSHRENKTLQHAHAQVDNFRAW
jgi:hypothetical protein